jgi:hypothetical protein
MVCTQRWGLAVIALTTRTEGRSFLLSDSLTSHLVELGVALVCGAGGCAPEVSTAGSTDYRQRVFGRDDSASASSMVIG